MIHYTDIIIHENVPFEDYLRVEAYSHSFLKSERDGYAMEIDETENMRRGTLVDRILTEPEKVSMLEPQYNECRDIAFGIKQQFGDYIVKFKKQISMTAVMHYGDFSMKVKGRLDFGLPGFAVIDLKIHNAKNFLGVVEHFGYKNQLFNYRGMYQVPKAYLMVHETQKKANRLLNVDCSNMDNDFWREAIFKFGTVNN